MDNETPQQNPPASSIPEPTSQAIPPSSHSFGGGMKVIQPLNPDIKPENPTPQPPAQPIAPTPATNYPQGETANATAQPIDAATQQPQTVANPSSVYPEATHGLSANSYQIPNPADSKKDTLEAITFDGGYSVGGSIFWNQLIAGIVFGVIFYGLTVSVLKTSSTSLATIVGLLYYVIEYLILIYIPYRILKSNAEQEPLWLTLFGVAAQSVIVVAAFELVSLIIIKAVLNHGVSSSLSHVGGTGLGAIAIVVYIGFFIASYFLTKLSWGIAFSLFGKIKNKMIVKAIGIGVIAIIVGGIGYHYLTLHSPKNGINISTASSACQSNGLCNYKVSGSPSYSADFYKGAKVINSKSGQGLIDYATTPGQGVNISVATASPSASCSSAETNSTFDIQVQGVGGTVCVFNNTVSNLVSYTSYVQLNSNNYEITMISYTYQQNLETVKSIFNSVVIN